MSRRSSSIPSNEQLTDYSKDGVDLYEQLQKEMNYIYDGFKTNVLHQLSMYLKDKDTSKMCFVDVACGNGNYSRWLSKHYKFKRILAVDLSQSEIDKAIKETDFKKYPNIKYQAVDASTFHTDGDFADLKCQFDCAILPWFFGYATSKAVLDTYMKSVHFVLKPNVFMVGCTITIDDVKNLRVGMTQNDPSFLDEVDSSMKCEEGLWIHISGTAKFRFIEYLYTHATYQQLFEKNGFKSCAFLMPNQWIDGWNSSDKELEMMAKFVNSTENFSQIFMAQKAANAHAKSD